MKFSFNIADSTLRAFGFDDKTQFLKAIETMNSDPLAPSPKPKYIPMMTARRLSTGCRMGVDCGMELCLENDIDAVVYSSSTGELEHNEKLLKSICSGNEPSPTDFSMSVHNCGVGNFTILSKKDIPSTSVAAGPDSFVMGLLESVMMLKDGHKSVLYVDYDVKVPDFFLEYIQSPIHTYPKAVGLVIMPGEEITIESTSEQSSLNKKHCQALDFISSYLKGEKQFTLQGEKTRWRVSVNA